VLADVAKQHAFEAAQGAATDMAKGALKTATDIAAHSVQSVQTATRAATSLAAAAGPVPASQRRAPAAVKKTTAAKDSTARAGAAAKKATAPKAAPAGAGAARRPSTKAAR
jgi:hypothetical protein